MVGLRTPYTMLHQFITSNRDEIISRCRDKVAKRSVPSLTQAGIDHGIPVFLAQLVDSLQDVGGLNSEISRSAVLHGNDLRLQGLSLSQVVYHYGDVCQAVTDLAMDLDAPIGTDDFRALNRCLDDAIAGAVTEFGRGHSQFLLDGEAARLNVRLGFLAHELRNLMNTALIAFEVLKTGNVGVTGSTGQVLHRSLLGVRALIGHSLAETRLSHGIENRRRILVSDLIDELTPTATLEAEAQDISLTVVLPKEPVWIYADQQILDAVIANLLQNAMKFTRPRSAITLRVKAASARVLIEVEDECGGLPGMNVEELFRPFRQGGADRTGLGLGLAFSRWAAEAQGGRLQARNLPGKGCVFCLDLPQMIVSVGTV